MLIDTHFDMILSALAAIDAASLADAGSPGGVSLSGPQPLITGPAPILAGGVVAVCLLMLLVFFLLMRGRARRAIRRREVAGKDFFQPAGAGADISFDDDRTYETVDEEAPPFRQANFGERGARFVSADQGDLSGEVQLDEVPDPEPEAPPPKPKKRGPFAGLFSRGKKEEAPLDDAQAEYIDVESQPVDADDSDAYASVSIVSDEESERIPHDAPAPVQAAYEQPDYRDTDYHAARARAEAEAAEIRARAEADAAEARRRAEADAAAMRRRAEEEAERQAEARRLEERKRFQEEEAAHERARLAAAEAQLAEREKKLSSDASNMEAEISRRLEERFAALAANYDSNGVSDGDSDDDERHSNEMRVSGRAGDDDVYQTLEAVEDALVAQSEALKAETRNQLNEFAARFEKRMASLSSLMEQSRVASAVSAELSGAGDSNAIADLIAQRLAEHRDSVNDTLASLSKRIDEITKGPEDVSGMRKEMAALRTSLGERNLGPTAPLVQLADIIGNALPPNAYALGAILSNGRKADCLVKLPHPPGPVAIDARFPVEAFNRLHEAHNDREAADNEFRRTALRHIVDIAERLISPEETAESALMFIPSESMYAEFHARFPDVVQDSYRARVWIVSPTTLMATLHTIRAILRDARSRENAGLIQAEAQHVLTEVEQLRQRVASLESSFDRARDDVRSLASSTDKVYRRAETITNTGRALAEENLDRGSRRIISAPSDEDAQQPAMHQPRASASAAPSSQSQRHAERSGAPETTEPPEGAPTIYRDNPYRRGSDKIGSQPRRDPDRPQTPFPLR